MLNSINNTGTTISAPTSTMDKFRKTVLLVNGYFLLIVGLFSAIAELVSYFWGIGPHGMRFFGVPYTIGFFEAHGLAAITGVLLIRAATRKRNEQRLWHGVGATVALLLGGSNLLFWPTFVALNFVIEGVVATIAHIILLVLQLICYFQAPASGQDS